VVDTSAHPQKEVTNYLACLPTVYSWRIGHVFFRRGTPQPHPVSWCPKVFLVDFFLVFGAYMLSNYEPRSVFAEPRTTNNELASR
jgi:hypothetical protein